MKIHRALACLLIVCPPMYAERRVAMIVDTSNSMKDNDPQRYAAQIAKILSDLTADDDHLMVIRMPSNVEATTTRGTSITDMVLRAAGLGGREENCTAGPNNGLAVELTGSRQAFKGRIEAMLHSTGGTFFAQPIHTAKQFLGSDRSVSRLMLFLADSGGFETNCVSALTAEMQQIRRGGTYAGLINLGASAGSFHGSPAFDSTAAAPDSEELVKAVAGVYQRFLGSNKTQTGSVSGPITVQIDPYVKEAFLVVASERSLAPLRVASGSTRADAIDVDYRGGGSTPGLDGVVRGYRIVRLKNPSAGSWTFDGPDLRKGGWMLLQDYSVALRSVGAEQSTAGAAATLKFELFDERTGQRIADPATIPGVTVEVTVDGEKLAVRDNGDGTYSSEHRFPKTGQYSVQARVSGGAIDRTLPVKVDVVDGGWKITSQLPAQAEVNRPVPLRTKLESTGPGRVPPPAKIVAETASGEKVDLLPVGGENYEGNWTPRKVGPESFRLTAAGGTNTLPGSASVDVVAPPPPVAGGASGSKSVGASPGEPPMPPPARSAPPMLTAPASFQFNTPPNMNLGTIRPRGKKEGQVTLDANGVPHDMDVQLSTDLTKRGLSVEIQTPNGWQKLGSSPVRQRLTAGSRMGWPIRVSAASCPAACSATEPHQITVEASLAGGGSASARIPVTVEVLPDPWLQCNWPLLAAGALLMVLSAVAYGFYWPYRFPNRLGVQLSPEVDLSEGFFYHLKKQHGAGSGFYRHARVFVAADFRISGKSNNAFARLRANRKDAMIQPAGGQGLWRQRIDGEWERLPDQETTARTGVMYRNDDGSVFFDLRLK